MSAERPDMNDDLDHAYERSHALADDGRGPPAAVRANVLAAARAVAAEAAARIAAEDAARVPLVPVAPPVAAVGRGRSRAINLASWRVRSGVALCAMLLIGVTAWRFDERARFGVDAQVALAERRLVEPSPRELPPPAAAASYPDAAPPAVVADPVDGASNRGAVAAKRAPRARDRDLVVAQLDQQPAQSSRPAPQPEAAAMARRAPPAIAPVPAVPPPPKAAADATPSGETTVAAAASDVGAQRVEVAAAQARFSSAAVSDSLKKSAPALAGAPPGASLRMTSEPLHAAADRGDVDTLKKLLADPATPVDAPDSAGGTALLHAVLAQHAAAVRLLLAAGADPGRADRAGLTPRAAAQSGASAEVAALLAAPH